MRNYDEPDVQAFAVAVRRSLRRVGGKSQRVVAEELGVSPRTLTAWARGELTSAPQGRFYGAIEDVLGFDPEMVLFPPTPEEEIEAGAAEF